MLFRAYSPSFGKWLSRDLIEESGGTNLYEYSSNNPVGFTDPSGLLPTPGEIDCGCKSKPKFMLTQEVIDKMVNRHAPGPAPKFNTNDRGIFRKEFWNKFDNEYLKKVLCADDTKQPAGKGRDAYVGKGLNQEATIHTSPPSVEFKDRPIGKVYPVHSAPYDTFELTVIVKPHGNLDVPQQILSIYPGPPSEGF